jgi:hypothetical protein
MLLVAGVHGASPTSRALALPPLTLIGLISYSLYLWHWPIIVLIEQSWPIDQLDWTLKLGVVGLATPLAFASWRWVERPWRSAAIPARSLLISAIVSSVLFVATGAALVVSNGWPARYSARVDELAMDDHDASLIDVRDGVCFVGLNARFGDFASARCLRSDSSPCIASVASNCLANSTG